MHSLMASARVHFCIFVLFTKQEHIDYLSLQSLLYKQTALGFYGQLKIFYNFTSRISD
jgi:hypothetical protein